MSAGVCCPTCGQALPSGAVPIEALIDLRMTAQQREIVAILARAYPREVGVKKLISDLWSEDPNGGPLAPLKTINTQMFHVRKRLAPAGWTIPPTQVGTGNHGRYRLARVQS